MQQADGYVSLHCNIGGDFGERAPVARRDYCTNHGQYSTESQVSLAHSNNSRNCCQRQPMPRCSLYLHRLHNRLAKLLRSSAHFSSCNHVRHHLCSLAKVYLQQRGNSMHPRIDIVHEKGKGHTDVKSAGKWRQLCDLVHNSTAERCPSSDNKVS